ncbi:MAG TPA: hypothetical protein VEG34_08285, partial [Thermoanaerobaculia bacterium]|nr:hypothetical protein [Thermoanaerobaculia bacterium]
AQAHGTAVLLRDAQAFHTREAVSNGLATAENALSIPSGTSLRILSVEPQGRARYLVEAGVVEGERPVFLSLRRASPLQPLELGRSLREIVLSAAESPLPDLADTRSLEQALAELRAHGEVITWASIVAGDPAPDKDPDELAARVAHVRHVLEQAGVDGKRATVITGSSELPAGSIRVRIFGYTKGS